MTVSKQARKTSTKLAKSSKARTVNHSAIAQVDPNLQPSEAYFRPLIENTSDVIAIVDATGIIRFASPSIKRVLGYDPHQVIGRSIFEFVHPEDLATAQLAFKPLIEFAGNGIESMEVRCLHQDGSWRVFQVIGNNCLNHPVIAGIVINLRDVTEQKQTIKALAVSESRLRQITDSMLDVITQVDLAGNHLYVSPSIKKVLGYDVDEIMRRNIYDMVHPDDLAQVLTTIQASIENHTGARMELRYKHADDRYLWLESMGSFLFDEVGNPSGAILASRDVTARRQREKELEAIAAMSASLRTAPSRGEMIPVVLDHIMSLLEADGAALALRDQSTGNVVIEMARGEFTQSSGTLLKEGDSISSQVIATGQPYILGDGRSKPRFASADMLDRVRAFACVPLSTHQQTIGALWIGRANSISDSEIRLLTALADIAANAIHRAALYEQTELRLQRLDALNKVDKAISSSLDLQVTLSVLLDQVTLQLRVDAAAVILFNSITQTLQFIEGRGFHNSARLRIPMGLSEDYAGRAVLGREKIFLPDLSELPSNSIPIHRLAGEGFRAYMAIPLIAKGQVKGVLEIFHRSPLSPESEWMEFLDTLARDAAIAIDNVELYQGLQRSNLELIVSYDATLEGWSRALDLRDSVTEGHTQRVVGMTLRLARALDLPESDLSNIRRGALLHDIGKIGVPDAILRKPGVLLNEEWEIMRKHPVYAFEMLSPIAYLRPALEIPYCHHEHWDGDGYPRGLKGEEIPFAARMFSIVDVWDALRTDRPYRRALPEDQVREYIHASAGILFDPKIVTKFLEIMANDARK